SLTVSGTPVDFTGLAAGSTFSASTVVLDQANAATLAVGAIQLQKLNVNKSGGATVTLQNPGTNLLGDLQLSAGTLALSGQPLGVAGNATVAGTLTTGAGSLAVTGTT